MSPRPKTASDDEILDAAARVILRVGPTSLRLADVADEIGLAPATLLQRFTSKRALLLAVAAHGTKAMLDDFAARRRRAATPLDALLATSPKVRAITRSRKCLTNKLAFLQLGLSDPAFRRQLTTHNRVAQDQLRLLLDEAIVADELRPCDTHAIAHLLVALWHGSLLLWALTRSGNAEVYIRADVEAVLAPYRTSATPAERPSSHSDAAGRKHPRPAAHA